MKILFIHQNFPGQFKHLAPYLRSQGHDVVGLGDRKNIESRLGAGWSFPVLAYAGREGKRSSHHYLNSFEAGIRRGQDVARAAMALAKRGFRPDVVIGHPGWGELLFVKDVFPDCKLVSYFEYFYQADGGDFDFDPEFPSFPDDRYKLRIRNSAQVHALSACDAGVSPTLWQRSTYPRHEHSRIEVIHEGIDLDHLSPNPEAVFALDDGRRLTREDQVITYVSRQLEPYRGFHTFMRALPELQRALPAAHIVIVGGDSVSYGRQPPAPHKNYREMLLSEVGPSLDMSRTHFVGRIPYERYVSLLQVSKLHIYLTYPFVLSWSVLEAMACGAPMLASRTAPVEEVITQGVNGCLFDFFDRKGLVEQAKAMLGDDVSELVNNARSFVEREFSVQRCSLPRYRDLLARLSP